MEKNVLKVEGMSCGHCENRVKKAVGNLTGVGSVDASFKEKSVTIEFDPSVIDLRKIRETIEHEGYDVVS